MWVAVAVAGTSLVTGLVGADAQRSAGNKAADAQSRSDAAAIEEQRRQFDALQKLLSPWVTAGQGALTGQQDLLGTNGAGPQQAAIDALKSSPAFTSMLQQGENSILSNASATGGLRGGNVQGALAQFSPQLLAQLIDSQYSKLGGLSTLGQNSAAGVGTAGMTSADSISRLLQDQGAAQAGKYLSQGSAQAGMFNSFGNALGMFGGLGGFGKLGGSGLTGDTALGNDALGRKYGF